MLEKWFDILTAKQSLLKIKFICGICFLLISASLKAQQEPMYSQYMFNMLQINPAYAGNRVVDNITTVYRKQWINIPGAPTTATLSWDKRQAGTNVGYGLQVYNDKISIENTSGLQGFYSYRLPFEDSFLSFGLSGGVLYYNAALSQVKTTEGGDPLLQEDVERVLPTAGFGLLYGSEKWYVGFSIPALFRTKANGSGINASYSIGANNHYFLTGGYVFDISENFELKPSVLMKAVVGAPIQFDYNVNGWINKVVGLGVSYRTGDAIVGMIEFQVSPEFQLGYAYDYTISNLNNFTKWGTHELILRYEFAGPKSKRILSPRYY
ncbi:MAG TPA: type IX secretion system membrane protein PorP/SprF [Paludibacter sp.]|nr:type IX secretion system membrane protein PorP/SprF [Paludibacter sp.]